MLGLGIKSKILGICLIFGVY